MKSRSHEIGCYNWSYRSEIWPTFRQRCCRGAWQILELLEKYKPESRSFETTRDLAVRRPFALWIKPLYNLKDTEIRSQVYYILRCCGYIISIMDLLYKSHNSPVPYPTMHHFKTQICTCWDSSRGTPLLTYMDFSFRLLENWERTWKEIHISIFKKTTEWLGETYIHLHFVPFSGVINNDVMHLLLHA